MFYFYKGLAMGFINARSSIKGQVTIPAEIRRRIGLAPGGVLRFRLEDDGSVKITAKKHGAHGLKGIFSKPEHPVNDDEEIMETVWERNRPDRLGPRP
jgi:AbrB family looped-hinge helix DNA binding protein